MMLNIASASGRLIPARFDEREVGHASTVRQKSSPAVYSASGFSVIHHFAPTRLFVTILAPGRPRLSDQTAERLDHDREMHERLVLREQRGHVVVSDLTAPLRREHARTEEVDAAMLSAPLGGPVRGLAVVAPLADGHGTGPAAVHARRRLLEPGEIHRGRDERRIVEAHVLGLDGRAADVVCVASSHSRTPGWRCGPTSWLYLKTGLPSESGRGRPSCRGTQFWIT
jgi:hypothetical protein